MKIVLLISTVFSVILSIYYIVTLSKEYYAKRRYFRLAVFVVGTVLLNLYLIVSCWKLI